MVDPVTIGLGIEGLISGIGSAAAGAAGTLGTAGTALSTAVGGTGALTALGTVAGGVGALANAFGSKPKAPSIPAPAAPVQNPVGNQDTNKNLSQGPSFLAAAAAPAANNLAGGKSLLGQ